MIGAFNAGMTMRKLKLAAILTAALLCVSLLCACEKSAEKPQKTVIELNSASLSNDDIFVLTGSWYGWWKLFNTSGDWSHLEGHWFDCCAIAEQSGGITELLIWDENFTKDNYFALLYFEKDDGAYCLVGGEMLNSTSLETDAVKLRFDLSDGDGKLTLYGSYYGTHKGGFDYAIYLRPWGSLWTDDEKPFYYDDWYLPLIENGADMPAVIGRND